MDLVIPSWCARRSRPTRITRDDVDAVDVEVDAVNVEVDDNEAVDTAREHT